MREGIVISYSFAFISSHSTDDMISIHINAIFENIKTVAPGGPNSNHQAAAGIPSTMSYITKA
jgi:hypothetical protein